MAFLSGYTFRKEITIDDTNVDGNLTDFPMYVTIASDSDIGANIDSGGLNIRFTEDDGETLLSYERESFSVVGGDATGAFWVKVPSIETSGGAIIYVYYKDGATSDGEDAMNVWDSGFVGVWHMEQDPAGSVLDSTGNNNDLASQGAMTSGDLVTGIVGQGIEFDGTNDGLTGGGSSLDITTQLTLEAWGRVQETINDESIYHKWAFGSGYTMQTDGPLFTAIGNGGTNIASSATVLSPNTDYYMCGTYDGATIQCYIDGLPDGSPAGQASLTNSGNTFSVAKRSESNAADDGTWTQCRLDELRVSNVARSPEWIKFTYFNINSGELTLGAEEIGVMLADGGVEIAGISGIQAISGRTATGGIRGAGAAKLAGSQGTTGVGNVKLSGGAGVSLNNPRYVRVIEVGEQVFFLQKTRVRVGIVLDVIEDSGDVFYEIRMARMPDWVEGLTDALVLHESRVLPAIETESYPLIQDFYA